MSEASLEPPLSEPETINCVYVTGFGIENDDGMIRIVGWVRLPTLTSAEMVERRIVLRCAVSNRIGRQLADDLRISLGRGGH